MNTLYVGLALFATLLIGAENVSARSYFLPDYQSDGWNSRATDTNKHQSSLTCASFKNYYSSMRSDLSCDSTVRHPADGLNCYYCAGCGSEYKYTSANCNTGIYVLSDSCGGKYKYCKCKSQYHTAAECRQMDMDPSYDEDNICIDPETADELSICEENECTGLITKSECERKGLYCVEMTDEDGESLCYGEAKCQSCNLSYCDGLAKYSSEVETNCEYGCATGKEIDICPNLCQKGGCATCTACDSTYNLTACPTDQGVICDRCEKCGEVKYMIVGCAANYTDIKTRWCTAPKSTDCAALGYALNRSCSSTQMQLKCPFNKNYVACL